MKDHFKRVFTIGLLSFVLILAGTINLSAQKKLSKSQLIAGAVAEKMLKKNLIIYITNIFSDAGTENFTEGFKVTLINDKFTCMLPYKGKSSISTYGSQDLYISAEEVPVEVESTFNTKKNFYLLKFQFTSKFDNELFDVSMKIFTNGKVSMDISSPRRSVIKYSGGLYI